MFIDVTRPGCERTLRLAAPAIAYLDTFGNGTAIHLIGGEMLRVVETREKIEADAIAASNPPVTAVVTEVPPPDPVEPAVAIVPVVKPNAGPRHGKQAR